jgi:hypothetical protein
MNSREAREKTAGERLARTLRQAARAHERALLVELWAAEYFERKGHSRIAERHRKAAERQATLAETRYTRVSELL